MAIRENIFLLEKLLLKHHGMERTSKIHRRCFINRDSGMCWRPIYKADNYRMPEARPLMIGFVRDSMIKSRCDHLDDVLQANAMILAAAGNSELSRVIRVAML
jgi:hypothetical protein